MADALNTPQCISDCLQRLATSVRHAASMMPVPAPRISAIVHGRRAISADTALRLGAYFKMEPQFWLNLQSNYDLAVAESGTWSKIKKFIPAFLPSRAVAVL